MLAPCPVCGKKAALIQWNPWPDEPRPTEWSVECSDFEDHGAWQLPIDCNFHHVNGSDDPYDVSQRFPTPAEAVHHWNAIVVPIATLTIIALERLKKKSDSPPHQ